MRFGYNSAIKLTNCKSFKHAMNFPSQNLAKKYFYYISGKFRIWLSLKSMKSTRQQPRSRLP